MTSCEVSVLVLRPNGHEPRARTVPVETPVAVEVDGVGYAVMMMTPADLPEFATGFLLTERLIDTPADLIDLDLFEGDAGWIVRATLAERCAGRVGERVRHRTSDTSCGLCGIAGLEQLRRPVPAAPPVPAVTPDALFAALAALRDHQPLNASTGAVHAAAACDDKGAVLLAYEDVGRHNALDKLIGAMARMGARIPAVRAEPVEALPFHSQRATENGASTSSARTGTVAFLLVTSRVSFEMVDKALVARAPLLMGLSAPTSMAIDHAREHGLTLVALARSDAMLVLNDPAGLFGRRS